MPVIKLNPECTECGCTLEDADVEDMICFECQLRFDGGD